MALDPNVETSPLGKHTAYVFEYQPELLHPIPREPKRRELGIGAELPFQGVDIWNAYELSWLNPKGKPVVAVAEFHIPCDSSAIIESKSFKLYLNSFNQSRFDSFEAVQAALARDLSQAAGAPVAVTLKTLEQAAQEGIGECDGVCLDTLDIEVDAYEPRPELLRLAPSGLQRRETLYSHLLKSNCPVTGQPDWGTLIISYRGAEIDRAALLRYIVSYRQCNDFHEQCVERIFMDIRRHCRPESLTVTARYVRRGGLDINPWRSTEAQPAVNTRLARQ